MSEVKFRDRFGFTALAIWRNGDVITDRLRDTPLKFGDALLLQGSPGHVAALVDGNEFLVLQHVDIEKRGPIIKHRWLLDHVVGYRLGNLFRPGHCHQHGDRLGLDGADRVPDHG